jgi:hypothetical protein
MSRASSIYFILVLAPAFSLSSFYSDSLYIRVGLRYTAGSSFTSSPQGSGQVERKTYITLPVSPSLNHSSMLLCVLSAVSMALLCSIDVASSRSELTEEVVKALVVRTLGARKK